VWTGFAISFKGKIHTQAVQTQVKFRKLSAAEIRDYVRTGEPMDKAGAYGAQGRGMTLIAWIQGSYTNVVGLPVAEVLQTFRRLRVIAP
jgi:septum formation protein